MTSVSTQWPMTAVSAAAASRTKISTSLKWARKRSQAGLPFFRQRVGAEGLQTLGGLGGAEAVGMAFFCASTASTVC
jgi:hypothetical protein